MLRVQELGNAIGAANGLSGSRNSVAAPPDLRPLEPPPRPQTLDPNPDLVSNSILNGVEFDTNSSFSVEFDTKSSFSVEFELKF